MTDEGTLFATARHIPAPDLWTEISARAADPLSAPVTYALPRHPRSRIAVAVVALLMSGIAVGAAIRALRPAEEGRQGAPDVERIHVGRFADDIVALDGSLWVSSERGLTRVDPRTGDVSPVLEVERGSLAASDGLVWVLGETGMVTRVDVRTGAATSMTLPDSASGAIEAGFGSGWVSQYKGAIIFRVDEVTGDAARIDTGRSWPVDLAATTTALWYASHDGVVERIEPSTSEIDLSVDLRAVLSEATATPIHLTAAGESLWVTVCSGATVDRLGTLRRCSWSVVRIDGSTGTVTERIELGVSEERPVADGTHVTLDRVQAIAATGNSLWVAINDYRFVGQGNPYRVDADERGSLVDGRVIRLDASSGELLDHIELGGRAVVAGVVDAAGVAWAVEISNGDIYRLPA